MYLKRFILKKKDMRSETLVIVVVCLFLVVFPSRCYSYLFKDEARGTHLSILGLGMVRLNYSFIEGDILGFEESDDGFREGVDTQEFLSLTAQGIVFRNYALEGNARYSEDDDPDWNFRVKLARDESYLIFGDQPNIFETPYFTRYASPFRGLTLHLERDEKVGLTTVGAVTKGTSEKQELVPDGTSGPYFLDAIPVVPGSEIVTLEVRNRNDEQQVLELDKQERNVDYTIDYDNGEINFTEPVERETFRGDPVVIVVRYRTESESSSFQTAILGARVAVSPASWGSGGATYISEFNRDPLSDGFESRQEIYGIDTTVKLGEAVRLNTEYALSQTHADAEDAQDLPQAMRARLDVKLGANLEFFGEFERAERDFLTFANPYIDPNEQELQMVGRYFYRDNQLLELGYSFWQDNITEGSENPSTLTHRPYIAWEAYLRDNLRIFSRYEYLKTTDDQTPDETDKQTHVFLVGGMQEFLTVPLVKKMALRAEYQRSDFDDYTDEEADTITHQAAVRLSSELAREVQARLEQRERLIHEKALGENTERQDISEVSLSLNRWQRWSADTKYQYKATHDLLLDKRASAAHIIILSADYKPLEVLTSSAKLEFRDETFFYPTDEAAEDDWELVADEDERASRTFNAEARLVYTPIEDLTARLRYEYQQTEDTGATSARTLEDTTEFRVNYAFDRRRSRLTAALKVERDLLESPPTPETETRTTTYLFSGARQMTDRWDVLAQYKRETVELNDDNFREDFLGEIGYKAGRFLKIVGGYQHARFQDKEDSTNDYTANLLYVKIIGKL